jgi:4-oxalocrotonate tautomerase
MPLVQISSRKSTSQGHAERVGEAVHRAMVNAIGIPEDDHFQIITEHEAGGLVSTVRLSGSSAPTGSSSK